MHFSAPPTCSVELFSAVLGRLEDRGFSEVSEREEGLLEGTGESGWWRSEWPDTAADAERQKKVVHFQLVLHRCGASVFRKLSLCILFKQMPCFYNTLAAAEVDRHEDSLRKLCIIWGL